MSEPPDNFKDQLAAAKAAALDRDIVAVVRFREGRFHLQVPELAMVSRPTLARAMCEFAAALLIEAEKMAAETIRRARIPRE